MSPMNHITNETTPLLQDQIDEASPKTNSKNVQSEVDVPYKNIEGKRFKPLFCSILMAYTLAFFDSTLMSSSHPVITSYFQSSNAASWLSTVFYLSSTVSQPIYGRVSDTIGRRPVYVFCIVVFGLTTVWCALAQSIISFIAARAVCGLGAGGVIAMTNVLLADIIKIEYRGIYQSYLNMSYGFGNSLGAAAGGFLCDRLGWRGAFAIQLPFIGIFLVLASFSVPQELGIVPAIREGKSKTAAFKTFDFYGAIALTISVSGLILGINLGGNILPWKHPIVIASLIVCGITLGLLILIEMRATRPILPLHLLSTVPMGNLIWSNFLFTLVLHVILFNFPLLLQAVWQKTPTASGLYLLSALVAVSISSVFTGFFIKRTRKVKPTLITGMVLLLIGPSAVSILTIPGLPEWTIPVLNPWTSLGQGFSFPSTTVSVLAISLPEDQAVTTTTLGLIRSLGTIIGVAVSSWIFQNVLLFYLQREVTGSETVKRQIIGLVRESVHAIEKLSQPHKAEVIRAYAQALRLTILSGAVFAVVAICLVAPLRLPEIKDTKVSQDDRVAPDGINNEAQANAE